jgi:molecular chaperone IbpA
MSDPFSALKTFGIGYDSFFKNVNDLLDLGKSISQSAGYPPFNISKIDENNYLIEMAVAGFGKSNLDITLSDGVLTINGKLESDDDSAMYLHKGIANRAFTRKFALVDSVEIKNADLVNGMLKIFFENVIPEHKKPRKISIGKETEKISSEVHDAVFQEAKNESEKAA